MRIIGWLFFLVLASCSAGTPKSGDLVFQDSSPVSNQADAIKALTGSKWTHCGIYFDDGNGGIVVEAVGTSRKYSKWDDWRERGARGRVGIRGLERDLTEQELKKLKTAAMGYAGRSYDLKFAWGDDAIYCSELIWKAYRDALDIELSKTEKLGDFNLSNSHSRKLIERSGSWGSMSKVPKNEPVVSPEALYKSRELVGR